MDISLNWVNRYVQCDDIEPAKLAQMVTNVGLEVEGMHALAYGTKLVVGYVKSCQMHPDSDHLHVCEVEIGDGVVSQIVCGAPNVAADMKVIVALPGCELPGGTIKQSVIRGQESNGMICSLSEIGIDARFQTEEQKAGIEILPEDAPVGQEALSYLGLKDEVLEVGLTPNRSDCMAITSFAYEVGAVLNRPVHLPEVKMTGKPGSGLEVEIQTDLCPFFGVKLVKGVKTKESPQWLKSLLMASGIKPINNVVDISNFVMLETGQPIHMYDYDKLKSKKYVIKTGFNCKETLLDGQEYDILPTDLIVSENDEIACIAGVMGADSTKIDENSTNIVIEAATFDGPTLRATARRLNLLTDASNRFIKNALNTKASPMILERCANLLVELADASEIYESVMESHSDIPDRYIDLKTERVNHLLGTKITDEDIKDIFTRLCFSYTFENGIFHVQVPSYRNDMSMEADLIEEVARMYGYDNIPSTLPPMKMTVGKRNAHQEKTHEIRHLLADLGLHETMTYSLTSPALVNDFNMFHTTEQIALLSPLSEERSVMRQSLLPAMLQAINYNESHSQKDVSIFEFSKTYTKDQEIEQLALALTGIYHESKWQQISKPVDFYVVKGLVESILKRLGFDPTRYQFVRVESDHACLHPGRSAYLTINKKKIGFVGEIHPNMAKKYDVSPTYVAQINLTALYALGTSKVKYTPISMYPSVVRDIALVVDEKQSVGDMLQSIRKAGRAIVKKCEVFDVYQGEHVEPGMKSVAIQITFQDDKKTLRDDMINASMEAILAALEKEYKAVLRA